VKLKSACPVAAKGYLSNEPDLNSIGHPDPSPIDLIGQP